MSYFRLINCALLFLWAIYRFIFVSLIAKILIGIKKSTQELYTLVNFGELRKKYGGTIDDKKGQKLQELVEKGSTSIRVKGKSVRVKTPICRALKKINEFESKLPCIFHYMIYC